MVNGEHYAGIFSMNCGSYKIYGPIHVVVNEETGKSSLKGVYAGGDIVTGEATVISAMGAGKKAARAIHKYLMKQTENT